MSEICNYQARTSADDNLHLLKESSQNLECVFGELNKSY